MTGFNCRRAAPLAAVAACSLMAATAHRSDTTLLNTLLAHLPADYQSLLSDHERFNLQILYTQINRDKQNRPHFVTFAFHADPHRYFYPASLVKLPLSALALDKINRLHLRGLTRETPSVVDNAVDCPIEYDSDAPSSADNQKHSGVASIGSSIKRMLLVSDNRASNRLWEFLTPDYITTRLPEIGFDDIKILHRLWSCSAEQNQKSNQISFVSKSGKLIYRQPPTVAHSMPVNPLAPVTIGKSHIKNGTRISRPFVADNLNYASLEDLHRFLMMIIFPSTVEKKRRLSLSLEDYRFLRTWMCLLPGESGILPSTYQPPDNTKKYFLYGNGTEPFGGPNVREFNVVGKAYGFIADVAYFADFHENIEFFLSAVMYANQDDVINDDNYEYETIALPFFHSLASEIYEYEKKRPRKNIPSLGNLGKFDPIVTGPQTR